jgi:uncharacterized protein YjbI with pentapeptide repeats
MTKKFWFKVSVGLIAIVLTIVILAIVANKTEIFPIWTGFGTYVIEENVHRAKTFWDWLNLLLVPVIIGYITWLYRYTAKKIEDEKRNKREKQETLELFLDRMNKLFLSMALEDNRFGQLAKAHMITALRRLEEDGQKKARVLSFLYESRLIQKENPIVKLWGVHYEGAEFAKGVVLTEANLSGALLNNANLRGAHLHYAVLAATNLECADLSGAYLVNAILYGKPSKDEYIEKTLKTLADIYPDEMRNFDKEIPAYLKGANLSNAKLVNANLSGVDLSYADLSYADLSNADLSNANLSNADLTNAILDEIKYNKETIWPQGFNVM